MITARASSRHTGANAIVEAMNRSQAIIHFEPDGTIIDANDNFVQVMGYRLEEIKGRHHSLFVEPEDAKSASYRAFWDSLRQGQYHMAQYRRIGRGGREVWIQASYNPLCDRDGRVYAVMKIATDITERKLEASDNAGQLEAINKSQAVIHFKLDGTIITANENFCKTMGYSLEEIEGKNHSMLMSEEDMGHSYEEFWNKLRSGVHQGAQVRRIGKGGKLVHIQANYNPIMDMNGNPFKVVKFASDITEVVEERVRRDAAISQIDQDLQEIQDILIQASKQAEIASSASSETANNVDSVARGGEQLSVSIDEISRQVNGATNVSEEAVKQAGRAGEIIASLSSSANQIGYVVNMISDIADQTNLLALNATIEAARAGEMGKGFAVVASEVKALANQSARATGEINGQIANVQSVTEEAVNAIKSVSGVIGKISEISTAIASAVEEQASVTRGISQNMNEATKSVNSIRDGVKQIESATLQVQDSTGKLKKTSEQLAA